MRAVRTSRAPATAIARSAMLASRGLGACALALAALGVLAACSEHPRTPSTPTAPAAPPATTLLAVVSEPVGRPASAVAAARGAAASMAGVVAYVSLPPGSVPDGTSASIRNGATGASLTIPLADGGFDPVEIAASVGDELTIDVRGPAGVLASLRVKVPPKRSPVVVRTSPPKGKTDVPLNSRIIVVFSEPIDPATLTATTVQLRRGDAIAAGVVLPDAGGLTAGFIPQSEFAPNAEYQLVVTTGVRDLSGDALQAAATVDFTTGSAATGSSAGLYHIHVANADGSGESPLAAGSWPSWSPDGRRIAFGRDGGVYVINTDGSNETRLAAGHTPAWSPDGTRIVFTSSEGISVMNADGSARRTLVPHGGPDAPANDFGIGIPAWSPDGALIAFQHFGDWDIQPPYILVVNSDGSALRPLRVPAIGEIVAGESDPSWSPDGSRVVYFSWLTGITTSDRNGRDRRGIYYDPLVVMRDARPAWSPDGSVIAFNVRRYETFVGGTVWVGTSVWTMRATGGDVTVLIPDGQDAAWSPDGTRIAFVRRRAP